MIEIINDFVNGRKALWLDAKLKKAKDEDEQSLLKQEAAERFALINWLPDAAKRAGQLSMTTHPSKFSHPSAKSTSIIATNAQRNDGYLRSGNVKSPLDVFGNAAAMDVYRFLALPTGTANHKTLLDAFEASDIGLQKSIANLGLDFETLKDAFLTIKQETGAEKTDALLKQVYFPVTPNHQYHLLSLLTGSGVITTFKERIDALRFSEKTKAARAAKRAGEDSKTGYHDLFDLTITGYGGTKPQNISVLNNQNYGRAYLLPCVPPVFKKRTIRLPKNNFFTQTLYLKAEKNRFAALHKWVMSDWNNQDVRNGIQNIIQGIIDTILYKAYQLRESAASGWSSNAYYQSLSLHQKMWLDNAYAAQRSEDDEWRSEIAAQIARIILEAYEKINDIKKMGDDELKALTDMINQSIEQDKEFF